MHRTENTTYTTQTNSVILREQNITRPHHVRVCAALAGHRPDTSYDGHCPTRKISSISGIPVRTWITTWASSIFNLTNGRLKKIYIQRLSSSTRNSTVLRTLLLSPATHLFPFLTLRAHTYLGQANKNTTLCTYSTPMLDLLHLIPSFKSFNALHHTSASTTYQTENVNSYALENFFIRSFLSKP